MSLRYLALGDSYTIGEGVEVAGRWPEQLVALLRQHNVDIALTRTVATTGWTTDELSAAMRQDAFGPPYELVSLLIGVNNQYRGRDVDNYRHEFRALLEWAVALAGSRPGRVLVLSIPDWGVTRFARDNGSDTDAVRRSIDAFNAVAQQEVASIRARWVEVTAISRAHADWLTVDGLHPDARQYALWAQAALPSARAALAPVTAG